VQDNRPWDPRYKLGDCTTVVGRMNQESPGFIRGEWSKGDYKYFVSIPLPLDKLDGP